jgi:large subunit ribosomal protein L5
MATISTTRQRGVREKLAKELKLSNSLKSPYIVKVVVNTGIGRLLQSASKPNDVIASLSEELAKITGQHPVITRSRKAIASFKTRIGMPLGLKVTLRGKRMEEFLARVIHVALPRSRDFKGIDPDGMDGEGNLTIGIREHTIFPEVADSHHNVGLEITIVTSTRDKELALQLLKDFGVPFKKDEE